MKSRLVLHLSQLFHHQSLCVSLFLTLLWITVGASLSFTLYYDIRTLVHQTRPDLTIIAAVQAGIACTILLLKIATIKIDFQYTPD